VQKSTGGKRERTLRVTVRPKIDGTRGRDGRYGRSRGSDDPGHPADGERRFEINLVALEGNVESGPPSIAAEAERGSGSAVAGVARLLLARVS